MPLTPKQRRFVAEYLVDLNATQAAIRAGYSKRTANRIASHLLSKVDIQTAVQVGQGKALKRAEMEADEWRRAITTVARFDIRKLVDPETGKLIPINELPDEAALCLASVKVLREKTTRRTLGDGTEEDTEESTLEVKAWDKLKALDMMGKHLNLLTERRDVTVHGSLAELLADPEPTT